MEGFSKDSLCVIYDFVEHTFDKLYVYNDDALEELDILLKEKYDFYRKNLTDLSDTSYDDFFKRIISNQLKVIKLSEALEKMEQHNRDFGAEYDASL